MASRKEEQRAARAEREAKAADAAKAERRKRRLKLVGAVVAAAALVVVIAIVISSAGGDDDKGGEQSGAPEEAAAVEKRFAGIEQDGFAVGDPKAPVTLVEFADLQCPFCAEAAKGSLPTLIDSYVRTGKLRIEFRNYAILGPDSEKAARAVEGAAAQDKAWQFIDLWYENQGEENTGYVTDEFIRRIASGVKGLNAEQVVVASNDTGNTASLGTAKTEAGKFGIESTPSFLIGLTGEQRQILQVEDPSDPSGFTAAIDKLLAQE